MLVVPVLFQDSPDPVFSSDDIQAGLFDGRTPEGTLGELYDEMSRGQLRVTGTVTPWHRSSLTLAETQGGELNGGAPARTGEMLLEALRAVDRSLDLSQLDNDGPDGIPNSGDDNGFVDALFFLYHEVGAHCGGSGPWPHFGGLSLWNEGEPYQSDDPAPGGDVVRANGYVLSTLVDCAGETMSAMPVAAHELGHVLGLPDLYHPIEGRLPTQRRWVIGCWGLMAAGAWGCGPSDDVTGTFGPTGMAPWAKDRLGWLEVVDVGRDAVVQEFVLEPVQVSGRVLHVPLDSTDTEGFIVEYRGQIGFDRLLPAEGVLIYRWHKDGWLRPHPDSAQFYLFSMMEADGDRTLQRTHGEGGNRGEAGDAWATGGEIARFTNSAHPRPNFVSGLPSTVTFHDIRVEGGVARITLSTAPEPVVVGAWSLPPGTAREPYRTRLPIGGGAEPYAVSEAPTLPQGVQATMVEGRELVVSGTPMSTGTFESTVTIRDALGTRAATAFRWVVARLNLSTERLLSPFLGNDAEPPSPEQLEVLDNDGNRNGIYDVGDLRAQLLPR